MKKIISFSLFVLLVILSLIARTASAQRLTPQPEVVQIIAKPSCPQKRNFRIAHVYRARHFRHYGLPRQYRGMRKVRVS